MKNEFIKMTAQERENAVRATLETMFKEVFEVKFIEEKSFPRIDDDIPPSTYWIYGFRIEQEESFYLHAATLGNDGRIDLRFHRIRAVVPQEKPQDPASGSLEALVRGFIAEEGYLMTSEADPKMISRNIRKYHTKPTKEQIRAEIFNFYNA